MTLEMLLMAQDALRKNMADQQAYRPSPAHTHFPGREEQATYRAVLLRRVARVLRGTGTAPAKVFIAE